LFFSQGKFGYLAKEKFIEKLMSDFDKADKDGNGQIDFMEFLRTKWEDGKGIAFLLMMYLLK